MSQYRKIFFSFAITAIGTATYAAPARTQDAAEVARRVEAARVQSFLDARYKASDVKHSFRTKLGDTIDCIDFFAQAGVKALAARGTPITKPPPSVTRPRNPDEPDENGNRRQCPDGMVPQVRITPDQIQRAGGLDAYLSRIKKFMGKVPSGSLPARSQRGSLTTSGPPEAGQPGYAHALIVGTGNNYTSGTARLSIFTPAVPSINKDDHSLMQTWTTTGGNVATAKTQTTPAIPCPANCMQTVEAGWTVHPGLNFDANPHLFVYSTPDGYWNGCYNGSIPFNIGGARTCPVWVGLPSSFPPGVTLPTSVPGITGQGGVAHDIGVSVQRCSVDHGCTNGWEVLVDVDSARSPVAIGYYPDSDFGGGFGTAAVFMAGGEVGETAAVPNDAFFTLPMGSGAPASAGSGQAAFVANLGWSSATGSGNIDNGGFGKPKSTVPAKYGAFENPNPGMNEIELGIAFYVGAPVPPPPPPPPPPPCPASGPDPQDRFFPEPSNSPVVVEQNRTGFVNLVLDGPWIGSDHGQGATGEVIYDNLPPGRTFSVQPAAKDNLGQSYALMEFFVTLPLNASPGSYIATVHATDIASCRTMDTNVPVQVLACAPSTTCFSSSDPIQSCGALSDGCGGTVNCGACPSGQACSNHVCCQNGRFYNTSLGVCQPLFCPDGTSFCIYTGDCATKKECKDIPICQKVGAVKTCQ